MTTAEFETLARDRGRVVRRLASFGREAAEDAVGDALLIVWRHRSRVEAPGEHYLFRVAFNAALSARRPAEQLDDGTLLSLISGGREPDDLAHAREQGDATARGLFWLTADEATAVLLAAAGHSYKEIASAKGWSCTKVNRAVTEGRARLRERVAA